MGTSNLNLFLIIFTIAAANLIFSSSAAAYLIEDRQSECRGSVAECTLVSGALWLETEFAMESEISRRILATTRYISYGALRRNTVPCSRRGASYYNCRPGAQANPYFRGCSAITRCR